MSKKNKAITKTVLAMLLLVAFIALAFFAPAVAAIIGFGICAAFALGLTACFLYYIFYYIDNNGQDDYRKTPRTGEVSQQR